VFTGEVEGGVCLVCHKEEYREKGLPVLETPIQDVRYGSRMLARRPAFAGLAILTLALGVAATTATFSIVDAVLLRPLPYSKPDRLAVVWSAQKGNTGPSKLFDSYRDFEGWQRSSQSFEQLEALTWAFTRQTLSWRGIPQRVVSIPATQGIFTLLGVHAREGRTFEPDDLKAECTVVLSHHFWRDRLGASVDVIGARLTLDAKPCTVIGVMPKDFNFYPKDSDLWTLITPHSDYAQKPLHSIVGVFGRLKPGVTLQGAQAELTLIHQGLVSQLPPETWIAQIVPVVYDLRSEFTWLAGRNLRMALVVLFASVILVLLIACLNVANLMLGRAGERQKELAIRAALGSGRGRLVRQLLTESLLLALMGGALGVCLATAGVAWFRSANSLELPPGNAVTVNAHVLAFTALLAVLTGLLFGVFPAAKASRAEVGEMLKQMGPGITRSGWGHRAGRLLVVVEAGLSLVLLVSAGLLIESIARFGEAPLGFSPDHLLTAQVNLPQSGYEKSVRKVQFYDDLTSSFAALPAVQGIALSSWLPLGGPGTQALSVEGRPAPRSEIGDVAVETVSAEFFQVVSIPLLRGREFSGSDREDSQPVAIINEALATEYFPNTDPIGRQIKIGTTAEAQQKAPWATIIGVVGNTKRTIVYQEMSYIVPPVVYRPLDQAADDSIGIIVRATGSPMRLRPALERAIGALSKDAPVSDVKTANDRIAEFLAQPRFRTAVLSAFAGLALLFAAIGLYGVLSQSVSQRTHEIGIRMALGAKRSSILRLVVGQGMTLAISGVALGLVAALISTRLLTSMLYGVKPVDLPTLIAVSLVLSAVALLATYIPARRATKIDPIVALRHE
jgi:predicted permease